MYEMACEPGAMLEGRDFTRTKLVKAGKLGGISAR